MQAAFLIIGSFKISSGALHYAAFQGHHRSHGSLSRRALCVLVGCRVGAEHEGAVLHFGRDNCRELVSAPPRHRKLKSAWHFTKTSLVQVESC